MFGMYLVVHCAGYMGCMYVTSSAGYMYLLCRVIYVLCVPGIAEYMYSYHAYLVVQGYICTVRTWHYSVHVQYTICTYLVIQGTYMNYMYLLMQGTSSVRTW